MQVFIDRNYFSQILFIAITSFISLSVNIEQAMSFGIEETQPTTTFPDSSIISSPIQNTGALTVPPTTLQQTGINNFANVNSGGSALNYPSCNGSCAFGILRTNSSNGFNGATGNQLEAVIGFIHSFSSPDQTNAETTRLTIEIQKYKNEYEIILALSEKLADAIETGKYQRANIISIILAPKLGKTHYQLLQEAVAKP